MTGTHGPIEAKVRTLMNSLARNIDAALNGTTKPKEWGFVMLVFAFDEDMAVNLPGKQGRINYASNAEREDVIKALEEIVSRFKGEHPDEQN